MATSGAIYNVVKKITSAFYMQQNGHYNGSCAGNEPKCWIWDIPKLLKNTTQVKYAVLILNRPVVQNIEFIQQFWNNATVRLTIDGGTIKWDQYIKKQSKEVQKMMKIPDLITGDFDSVTPELLEEYKKKGCKTVYTPDQNYTDFTKSLMVLNTYCEEKCIKIDHVVAIGESSGRIDQIIGTIQTLFLNKEKMILDPHTKVYIMSDDALSWLLYPGDHVIVVPEETRTHKRAWCSLIPIGSTCESVTSSGLKWNLANQPLKFGELVSTSNTFNGAETVTVTCSHTLLWSMSIPSLKRRVITINGNAH